MRARAASGRRLLAHNHLFIAYLCVPSQRQGMNPALVYDAFTSAALRGREGGGGERSWWAPGLLAGHVLAWEVVSTGYSRSSLLPSRSQALSDSHDPSRT